MTTDEQIRKRRKELTARIFRGQDVKDAAKDLAPKYDVKPLSIERDWYKRDEWMPHLFDLDDEQKIVYDIIVEQKDLKQELRKAAKAADNTNARVGALKQINKMNQGLLDMLQETGIVDKEPDKQEVEVSGDKFSINIEESEGDEEDE